MKNVLFVSIAFPPKNDPECLQTAKYFYYLQQHSELSIEVVTSAIPTLYMPVDDDLKRYDKGYSNKVEIPILENKYLNFILRKISAQGIDWPDSKKAFHLKWKQAVNSIRMKPDVIYSRSFPLSSTFLAYKLIEYYDIPWVMHLSDPWVDSPIHNYTPRQYEFHKEWEKKCIESAAAVCLTSEATISLYQEKYPEMKYKFQYFPNVFDPADMIENPYIQGEKIKIVYTGGLVGKRNISYLLNALDALHKEAPELLKCFEFIFAGALDRLSETHFRQSKYQNVRHIGVLSYSQALKLQREADYLLIIDNPIDDPKKAVFFPSKLLDYFMAQRKILAITTLGGATDNVLGNVGESTFSHSDTDGLKNHLIKIATAFNNKDLDFFKFKSIPELYSAPFNANKLKDLLLSL